MDRLYYETSSSPSFLLFPESIARYLERDRDSDDELDDLEEEELEELDEDESEEYFLECLFERFFRLN